jgi:hypothetical protein
MQRKARQQAKDAEQQLTNSSKAHMLMHECARLQKKLLWTSRGNMQRKRKQQVNNNSRASSRLAG